jgi:hypothetical protein
METFISKLSRTRAGERSRLWLEGARLASAGFKPGDKFLKHRDPDAHTIKLVRCTEKTFADVPRDLRGTVSGKGEQPIIDLVGAQITGTFRTTHVQVAYTPRAITIMESETNA